MDDLLEDAPIWSLFNLVIQQVVGWPAYMFVNASGQARYPAWTNRWVAVKYTCSASLSHYQKPDMIHLPRHRQTFILSRSCLTSVIGVKFCSPTSALVSCSPVLQPWATAPAYWRSSNITSSPTSGSTFVLLVLCPLRFPIPDCLPHSQHWLVLITYLQHTDPALPHYREGAFNFQRGALCTIDRRIHGFFFHGIAETHVAHHLCSKIPHYHAWDATAALKAKLGEYYMQTDENFWVSLWKSYTQCRVCPSFLSPFLKMILSLFEECWCCWSWLQFVEDEGEVVFYKNAKGQAVRRLVMDDKKDHLSDSGVDVSEK